MYKLVVFDLDGTLAELGQGILPENLARLKALEDAGARIAICSGKPTYYLCGFMRQVGLKNPILIGENGAVIQFGVSLPPRDYYVVPYSDAARRSIQRLRHELERALPTLWYQPNLTALTPFPKDEEEFSKLAACIEAVSGELEDVSLYRHVDCFDVVPNGISKQSGLEHLGNLLHISAEETIAVGDGVNDYPMFAYAGLSIGIQVAESANVSLNVSSIEEALTYIASLL